MIVTTASRLRWPTAVGVFVDDVLVAVGPTFDAARACAAELRAQPRAAEEARDDNRNDAAGWCGEPW